MDRTAMRGVEHVERDAGGWPPGLADQHLWQRFYALLDDHDLKELFEEFIVPVRRFE
jgi:hypothetical protein